MLQTTRRDFLKTAVAGAAMFGMGGQVTRRASAAEQFAGLDALGQAELVKKKQVKPVELVEAAIARIEKLNPQINAVVTKIFEQAIDRAKGPVGDGPFAGVPYLIKDLLPYKGARHTYGSKFYAKNISKVAPELVKRSEEAGLIVVGKTNTPEFGMVPITEPKLFGATHNPWNLDLTPGGSSGGAAAAVAAGMVPMAHASDGGGSIRIPASCCGVFGMKISRGRNPDFPVPNPEGVSVQHCVSRSVRDSAALLDVTQGPVPGERWWTAPPTRSYLEEVTTEPGKLKIAYTTKDFAGNDIHPDCVAAVETTVKLCRDLGHEVEEVSIPIDGSGTREAFLAIWAGIAGTAIRTATQILGREPNRDDFELATWQLADVNDSLTPADVRIAWNTLLTAGFKIAEFMQKYDVILTSVVGLPPLKIGELDFENGYDTARVTVTKFVPYTPVFNATGQPAMSVPLYWNKAGVPIGSHFVGRLGEEALLFRLAGQLERTQPWANRWAPHSAGAK